MGTTGKSARPARPVSRRLVLGGGGAAAAAVALAGCDAFSTEPSQGRTRKPGKAEKQAKEAPGLAADAKAGRLPALQDRLPDKPLEVQPADRAGGYGGTWRSVLLGASDTPWLGRTVGYDGMTRWDPTGTKIIPNVVESFEASTDARVYTVKLRPGMRWSDGKPFTADDIVFSYEDVWQNTDLTPVFPSAFISGGKPGKLEKVDDYTVRLTFKRPNAMLPTLLAGTIDGPVMPRHYLKQFHVKFNPNAKEEAKKQGVSAWTDLFLAKVDPWGNKDLPRLTGWVPTNDLGKGSRFAVERNPYYWKVDPDGRQLPYIDQVVYDVISDAQTILLKASNGEFGLLTRDINTVQNKPVLARNREKGKYHFVTLQTTFMNDMVVMLNLNHEDPVLRAVFQKKDFRIGLSHAIDREEMSKAVWQRQGRPWQAAPLAKSKFYDEEFATQFTEHDAQLANQHLDKAGLTERDGDGFRLRPDGKRLSFVVEVANPALVPFWADGMQLVVGYWKKVGVDAQVKTEDRSLFGERTTANKHDACVWMGPGGFGDETLKTFMYFPSVGVNQAWAVLWAQWYLSRGAGGEKPPAAPRKQMELYWQFLEEPDEAKREDLYRQILAIAKEQFYVIGTIQNPQDYGIAPDNFLNVPDNIPDSDTFHTPALTNPEQYFIQ